MFKVFWQAIREFFKESNFPLTDALENKASPARIPVSTVMEIPGGTPHQPIPPAPLATISLAAIEGVLEKPESLAVPIGNLDEQLQQISEAQNMPNLSKEVITKASLYLNDQSVGDKAAWLDALIRDGGNPAHWVPGEAYCISAAAACWGFVLNKYGIAWPFHAVPGTQQFYDNANAAEFLTLSPHAGDIVIYKDGNTAQGHAGIVISIDELDLHTIEFNTSANAGGNQRAGNGCFLKTRSLAAFHGPRNVGMWIRGYVGMSKIEPPPQPQSAQPSPYSA